MKKIVALVPMRHESKRVKEKNYRLFHGKPLFHWILTTLIQCPSIDEIYINTDSPIIKEQAPEIDQKIKIVDRPQSLCGDKVSMNEILAYDISRIDADCYLQTHSTNPLLQSSTIEEAIQTLKENRAHDSLFSVTKWQTRLWDQKCQPINHRLDKLKRTQDLEPIFEENSNIYIFQKDVFLKRKNRIGKNPLIFEISKWEAMDIDEEVDFQLAEALMRLSHEK